MLVRHSIIFVAAKALPSLLGMATTIILTRVLSPTQYGLYGLSLVVMTFTAGVGFDWLLLCLTRFYEGRHRDPKVVSTVLHLFAANVLLTAIVLLMIWYFKLRYMPEAENYVIGIVMTWSYAWFELVAGIEIVNLRSGAYFVMNSGRAVSVLVFAVGAAWLTRDPVWTGIGTAIGMFLGSLLRRGRISTSGSRGYDAALAREMIAFGLPLAVALLMGGIAFTGARAMVEWLGTPEALGYYTAAFVLVQNTLVVVSTGIGSASYQFAVRAVESGDLAAARRQLLDNSTLLLAAMAPVSLGVALTAKGIAITLVGSQYADAVSTLTPWMAASAFFTSIRACYFDQAFQLGHRPFLLIRVLGAAAVISIGLAYWLIPRMGPEGAAIAITISAAAGCILARIEGTAAFPLPLPIAAAGKILLACGVMALAVLSVKGNTQIHFVIQVVVGAFAYSASLVALNLFGLRERIFDRVPLRLLWWTR
jgi:O-antigen/teichoic acid export membrane protein